MSASPQSDSKDVEHVAPSPDDEAQMNDSHDPHAGSLAYDHESKEQDRWLPIANVARIMKTALPENAKIAKEAKECMQECVSEFISFITSEASEKCQQEKRKTVNGEDILFAMTSLGFENYAEALKIYLAKYREQQTHASRGDNNNNNNNNNRGNNHNHGQAGGYSATTGPDPATAQFPAGDLSSGQPEGSDPAFSLYSQTGHNGPTPDYAV